jgi:hypothetical protein
MNKNMSRFAFAGLLLVVLMISTVVTSCNKNKECKANVKVLVGGNPAGGVNVRLHADTQNGQVEFISSTDASGSAAFETQLPMILDIEVQINSVYVPTGKVARLEEGKTTDVTVEL